MFGSVGKLSNGSKSRDRRTMEAMIARDRPDLRADAGLEPRMSRYHDHGGDKNIPGLLATWWMPFHASAG